MFLHLCLFLFTGHCSFFPTSPISADLLLRAWSEGSPTFKGAKSHSEARGLTQDSSHWKTGHRNFLWDGSSLFCTNSAMLWFSLRSVCDLLCLLTNALHHFLLLCMYFANVLHLLGVIFLLPVSILCIFLVIFHQFPLLRSFLCLFDYFVSLFYYLVAAFPSFRTNFRLFLLLVLHISLLSNIAFISNNFRFSIILHPSVF